MRIVRPIMPAADVPVEQAHPYALRHTFWRLYTTAPKAELSTRERIMGPHFAGDDVGTSTTTITSSRPSIAGSSGCSADPLVLHNTIYAQRALDHLKAVDRTDILPASRLQRTRCLQQAHSFHRRATRREQVDRPRRSPRHASIASGYRAFRRGAPRTLLTCVSRARGAPPVHRADAGERGPGDRGRSGARGQVRTGCARVAGWVVPA